MSCVKESHLKSDNQVGQLRVSEGWVSQQQHMWGPGRQSCLHITVLFDIILILLEDYVWLS